MLLRCKLFVTFQFNIINPSTPNKISFSWKIGNILEVTSPAAPDFDSCAGPVCFKFAVFAREARMAPRIITGDGS